MTIQIGENEVELTPEILSQIKTQNGFITLEEAKTNQELFQDKLKSYESKFKAETLNGVDAELQSLLEEFTDTEKKEIQALKTGQKPKKMLELLKSRVKDGQPIDERLKAEIEMWKEEVGKSKADKETNYIEKSKFGEVERSLKDLKNQIMRDSAISLAYTSGFELNKEIPEKHYQSILNDEIDTLLAKGLNGKIAKRVYNTETKQIEIVQKNGEPLPIVKEGTADYYSYKDVVNIALKESGLQRTTQQTQSSTFVVNTNAGGNANSRAVQLARESLAQHGKKV